MPADKITAWHSFRLRPAKPGNSKIVGWYGGHPRGVRAHLWPRCSVCGAPMCHMMQLEAGDWLDLGSFKRMSVFICHATGGRCEDWDPYKGANTVLLHRESEDDLFDGPPTVRVYRRRLLTVDDPIDELAVMIKVKEQGLPMKDALQELQHDKLGGGAVWLHGDDTPPSRKGEGPMRLLVQFTTDLVGFDITPGGMGYVFIDPLDDTDEAAHFLWQGG